MNSHKLLFHFIGYLFFFASCSYPNHPTNTASIKKYLEKKKKLKIVVVGNSIVYHPPNKSIGWDGDWGMAASNKDSDFVHILMENTRKTKSKSQLLFRNIAEFERDYKNFAFSTLDSLKNPDILIIKISENVNEGNAATNKFISYYDSLVNYLAPPKMKTLKVVVSGFWDNKVNELLKDYAGKKNYPYISIADLSHNITNKAINKFGNNAVGEHPSDQGMRQIAARIWDEINVCFEK